MRIIDREKCIGCLKCVDDCINQYIVAEKTADGKVRPAFKERGICIGCRHCEAVCPEGAIRMVSEHEEEASDLPDGGEILDFMQRKRTHRHYDKHESIPEEKIQAITLAAQSAPTDRNRKTVRVIYIKELLPEIYNKALDYLVDKVGQNGRIDPLYDSTMRLDQKRDEILWNAEYLVVIAGAEQYVVDAAIAAERMQLMAESLHLGTAYRGDMKSAINDSAELREILKLRSNEKVLVSFALGVPLYSYNRKGNKNLKKIYYM